MNKVSYWGSLLNKPNREDCHEEYIKGLFVIVLIRVMLGVIGEIVCFA